MSAELCDFCEKKKATHFCMEWDAALCDRCCVEQQKEVLKVSREYQERPKGQTPLEFFFGKGVKPCD